jgi:hypothetical protein
MIEPIKITSLSNIGSNIATSTLIPVVDMGGTPTTKKANLQILGNLILNGATGSIFTRASQANIALTVANSFQPNITTVGTLTSLTVSGNINLSSSIKFQDDSIQNTAGIVWTAAPISNTSAGIPGQAAYDAGGNLYICVSANTWSKFSGTTSW